MKAAYIDQPGPPQNIHYGDLPLPSMGKRDVLVKVLAVDVNAVDTYIESGRFKIPLPFPFIIGRDVTGIVVRVGNATIEELGHYAEQINRWASKGMLKGKIAQKLPLSQAAKAYEIYETQDLFGKLVLSPEWEANE